ncbi:MAG TPA: hypothetical protein VFL97_03245 [Nitrococcus sp.]|nr:hypothetical protein [Nitrococcus sp.]
MLLTRGRCSQRAGHTGLNAAVAELLGSQPAPVGPISLLGAGGEPGESYWFRAAPIHLRPDRDRLLLLAGSQLQPREDETRLLLSEFNALFREDGLELVAQGGEWFLRVPNEPVIQIEPLESVSGRYLDEHLPTGPQARSWIAFLNEAQMLLHSSAVNPRREARGELPINGLWIWGGGYLPRWSGPCPINAVYADTTEARGAARLAGIEPLPSVGRLSQISAAAGPALAVWSQAQTALVEGDIERWWRVLAAFEAAWAQEALAALRIGSWRAVHLYPGAGRCWRVTAADLRRFWRRRRPLARWIIQGS